MQRWHRRELVLQLARMARKSVVGPPTPVVEQRAGVVKSLAAEHPRWRHRIAPEDEQRGEREQYEHRACLRVRLAPRPGHKDEDAYRDDEMQRRVPVARRDSDNRVRVEQPIQRWFRVDVKAPFPAHDPESVVQRLRPITRQPSLHEVVDLVDDDGSGQVTPPAVASAYDDRRRCLLRPVGPHAASVTGLGVVRDDRSVGLPT